MTLPDPNRFGLPVYQVRTGRDHLRVTGLDSAIAVCPAWLRRSDPGGIDLPRLGRALRKLSEDLAASIGEVLHHADWYITDRPDVIDDVGMHGQPGCVECRAATDQALAHSAERDEAMMVGALFWAEQPTSGHTRRPGR